MNYKKGLIAIVSALVVLFSFCVGYSIASHQRPVYNRVYSSDHKSIEKALKKAHVKITHEQLEEMYRSVKDDR